MKKTLMVAGILAALSISTVSAFANPVFSGDANIEYIKQEDEARQLTNRIRLSMDSNLGDDLYLHSRVNVNNDVEASTEVAADQVYLGANIHGIDVKAGRQPLFLGQSGLLADDNITGVQATAKHENSTFTGFYGKDGEAVSAVDMATTVDGVDLGATYLKHDSKYWGLNAGTKITDNVRINTEYVKNQDTKAKGYMAELVFGEVAKKGDINYAVSYRDIEGGAVSGYSTDVNYNDSKGLKLSANYKVTDNATLSVYHDLADSQNDVSKNRTDIEFSVKF